MSWPRPVVLDDPAMIAHLGCRLSRRDALLRDAQLSVGDRWSDAFESSDVVQRTTVSVRNLSVRRRAGNTIVNALTNCSFDAQPGEVTMLRGPSGSGKTTLLSCIAGLAPRSSGIIRSGDIDVPFLRGSELAAYRQSVGVVFQAFNLIRSLNVVDNIALPLSAANVRRRRARALAVQRATELGLQDVLRRRPGQLSGGQQQRVALARALVFNPPVILSDEPTAHLDTENVDLVLRLFERLANRGHTVIIATHDDRVASIARQTVQL